MTAAARGTHQAPDPHADHHPAPVDRYVGHRPPALERRADGSVAPKSAVADIRFSGGGSADLIRLGDRSGHALSLDWGKDLPVPVLEDSSATYADVLPDVDLRLTATAEGYQEVLVVKTAQAADNPQLARVTCPRRVEDDGRGRKLTSHGVRWRGRDYLGAWMAGQAGRSVRIRYMPHHDHEIEVFDPAGHHLGSAHLADAATPEQLDALRRARTTRARRLREETKKAQALRRQRFAPATTPANPQRLGAVTAAEADQELQAAANSDMTAPALPDLIPPAPPPEDWNTPPSLPPAHRTRPSAEDTR
ncbi:Mu transposase C-terminal domain-containing protein [Wenjunlia tyrosinilytica]|uniref:Mu transposase C-terminal domain-containing protein n=1 Tax=Wenjunlia tyrosinilytica TaxID=1544741 RepID=UPI00166AC5E2|nr:Mu transposase C-terminal domain-containing protein [Wenjunlia tyrosinilytica]